MPKYEVRAREEKDHAVNGCGELNENGESLADICG